MLVCDSAPVATDVGDCGNPSERRAMKRGTLLLALLCGAKVEMAALVVEEDLSVGIRQVSVRALWWVPTARRAASIADIS